MIRRLGIVVVIAMTAGCGATQAAPPSDAPAVAWASQVCEAAKAQSSKLRQPPVVDQSSPQSKPGLVDFLGSLSQAVGSLSDGIKKAGPPPVSSGQVVVDKALHTLGSAQRAVDQAKVKLAQAPDGDPAAFQQAMSDVRTGMAQLDGEGDPTAVLRTNKDLDSAFAKAPGC